MLDKKEKSALSLRLFNTDVTNPEGQKQFSQTPAHKQENANEKADDKAEVPAEAEAQNPAPSTDTQSASTQP
jgi:multisite-specific tRNA:(cytosine-C5)-methyltransferase